jgi:hypothetical protein
MYLADVGADAYFRRLTAAPRWLLLQDNLGRGLRHFVDLADGGGFHYVTDAVGVDFLNNPGPIHWNEWLASALCLVGAAAALALRPAAPGVWLVGGSLLFIGAFTYGAKSPHPHYLSLVLTFACLLIAVAPRIASGPAKPQGLLQALLTAAVLAIVAVNAGSTVHFLGRMKKGDWQGDYGIPYRDSLAAAEHLLAYADAHPEATIVLYPSDEHYAVAQLTSRRGRTMEVLQAPRTGVLVAFCQRIRPNQAFRYPTIDEWTSADGRLSVRLCRGEAVWSAPSP